jgi:threonine dehydrogenase-like Zn-dependent dehydrogenase
MGQTHVHKYVPTLLEHVQNKRIDPSFVITHRMPLDQAAEGYAMFASNRDEVIKVVLKP